MDYNLCDDEPGGREYVGVFGEHHRSHPLELVFSHRTAYSTAKPWTVFGSGKNASIEIYYVVDK